MTTSNHTASCVIHSDPLQHCQTTLSDNIVRQHCQTLMSPYDLLMGNVIYEHQALCDTVWPKSMHLSVWAVTDPG